MLCVLTVSSRNAVCFSFATTQPVRQTESPYSVRAERCMAALPLHRPAPSTSDASLSPTRSPSPSPPPSLISSPKTKFEGGGLSLSQQRELLRATQAAKEAQQVLNQTYLAPLVAMVNSHDEDIHRQAVCGLANLVGDAQRAPVAALRNIASHSLLCDLLEFTRPPFSLEQRKDAVTGLSNLLRNQAVHQEVLREHLLLEFLRLSRNSVHPSALVGRSKKGFKPKLSSEKRRQSDQSLASETQPPQRLQIRRATWDYPAMRQIVFCLTSLCANESLAPQLLAHGYVPELVRLAVGMQLDDIVIRRNAVYAVTALSFHLRSREEIKRHGGLGLATELLQERTLLDLRWHGAMLACNLCMHKRNKLDVIRSPLLPQLLQTVLPPPTTGEAEQVALALAVLATDEEVSKGLCNREVMKSLLCLTTLGSPVAQQHALWAMSNLATVRPTDASLLEADVLAVLIKCSTAAGAPSRSARRDALRALSMMCDNVEVGPSARRRDGVGTGELLEVVIQVRRRLLDLSSKPF